MNKKAWSGILSVIIAALFLLSFSACKKGGEVGGGEDFAPLTIGSDDYAPYFYRDENGEFAGIDVELAAEACRRIGRKAEFRMIEWSEKDIILGKGEVECLWGSFSMTGRENIYAWAGPYMKSRQVIAVKSDGGIKTFADLAGKSVAVQATSKPDEIFSKGEDARFSDIGHIYCFTNTEYIFAALKNGYADAIAGHEVALRERMKNSTGAYRILDETLLSVDLGVAFKKDKDEELAALVGTALRVMKNDGFTAKVLKKYGLDPDKLLAVSV